MSVTTVESAAPKRRSRRRIAFWCAGGAVLLGLGYFFLLNSRTCAVREPSRVSACKSNLANIALALENYHADKGSYPPAYIADENGRPMHSWRVLLLPYMECGNLYKQYRFDEPWDGPNNRKLASHIPGIYRCMSHDYRGGDEFVTTYLAIVGPNSVFRGSNATQREGISDGLDKTMLVADVNQHAVHWMSPVDLSPDELVEEVAKIGEETNHPSGFVAVFADGSVRLLEKNTTAETIRAMTTTDSDD